jgi:hypothetical protein
VIVDSGKPRQIQLLLNVVVKVDAEGLGTERHEDEAGAKVYCPEKKSRQGKKAGFASE